MQRGVTRVERVDTEKVAVLKYLFLWLKIDNNIVDKENGKD